MKNKFTLLLLLGSLTTFTSCVDFSGLQEAAQNEVDQLQAQLESNDYKDGLSNNFQDGFDLRDDDDDMYGFYGYGDDNRKMVIHRAPPMQHRKDGCNKGMSVDGGSIYRQDNGSFNFQNDPRYTMYNRGDDAMLGVMENGVPVYAKKDDDTGLDAQGGHYGPTADYPQGIYHYHVVINNYYY